MLYIGFGLLCIILAPCPFIIIHCRHYSCEYQHQIDVHNTDDHGGNAHIPLIIGLSKSFNDKPNVISECKHVSKSDPLPSTVITADSYQPISERECLVPIVPIEDASPVPEVPVPKREPVLLPSQEHHIESLYDTIPTRSYTDDKLVRESCDVNKPQPSAGTSSEAETPPGEMGRSTIPLRVQLTVSGVGPVTIVTSDGAVTPQLYSYQQYIADVRNIKAEVVVESKFISNDNSTFSSLNLC